VGLSVRDAPYLYFIRRYNRYFPQKWSFCCVAVHLISVVDDDESVREALCGLLRSVGFAVSAFASAEEFLSSDQPRSADCLVLDVRMPGMGGIELQRQLVAGHYEIPVILITAHEDEGMRARALSGGAGAVLIKPFSEDALLNAIRSALSC
jgi:FixJ family two-component response regulator